MSEPVYVYTHEIHCTMCERQVATVKANEQYPRIVLPSTLRCSCGGWPAYNGEWTREFTEIVPLAGDDRQQKRSRKSRADRLAEQQALEAW